MAISNLESLYTGVRSYANRSETVLTEELMGKFLQAAETNIFRNLRTPANESIDDFVAEADGDTVTIAPDFIQMRLVTLNNTPLEQASLRQFHNCKKGYVRFGSKFIFNPSFSKGDTVRFFYYEDLSGTLLYPTSTNSVLRTSPNVYLFGILEQAFLYMEEPEMSAMYNSKLYEEIAAMNGQARKAELQDGKMQMGASPYTNIRYDNNTI